LDRSA